MAIARDLINRPALLQADEPTGALDARNGENLRVCSRPRHLPADSVLRLTRSLILDRPRTDLRPLFSHPWEVVAPTLLTQLHLHVGQSFAAQLFGKSVRLHLVGEILDQTDNDLLLRDVAILKAVGMAPYQVVSMVISSVVLLGLVVAILGIPAGLLLYAQVITLMAQAASGSNIPLAYLDLIKHADLPLLARAGVEIAALGAGAMGGVEPGIRGAPDRVNSCPKRALPIRA